jgi:membrane protein YqaA with SNARE-associated domain
MFIKEWLLGLISTHLYLGAFVTSIFFPVPYILLITVLHPSLNPPLLGLVAGAGATVGELIAYILGYGGRRVISKRYLGRLEKTRERIHRHGVFMVFLYSLFPLPTGPVLVPLGMLKFDVRRAAVAVFSGKVVQCTVVAYAGKYSIDFITRFLEPRGGVLTGILSFMLVALFLYILFSLDWNYVRSLLRKTVRN